MDHLIRRLLEAAEGDMEVEYYAAQKGPPQLAIYAYATDYEDGKELARCSVADWEDFARYGAEQGGEWARLAHDGHSDLWRKEALTDLAKQLADVPEQYSAIAGIIREAVEGGAEGIAVSAE